MGFNEKDNEVLKVLGRMSYHGISVDRFLSFIYLFNVDLSDMENVVNNIHYSRVDNDDICKGLHFGTVVSHHGNSFYLGDKKMKNNKGRDFELNGCWIENAEYISKEG